MGAQWFGSSNVELASPRRLLWVGYAAAAHSSAPRLVPLAATGSGGGHEHRRSQRFYDAGVVSLSIASVVTDDIVELSAFYADVFDLEEIVEHRSEVFRGLDLGGVVLGFSPPEVYELLKIEAWRDARGTKQYLTFEVASEAEVDRVSDAAVARGANLLHEPYETYYGSRQSVLSDPEGNVFRINHFRP